MTKRVRLWLHLGAAVIALGLPRAGGASCNLIPGTSLTFNSTLGATNRPFAAPLETVDLRTRPCDLPPAGFGLPLEDNIITVIFTPPGGQPRAAVVGGLGICGAITARRAACAAELGVATVPCSSNNFPTDMALLEVNGVQTLRFRFPDTDELFGGVNDDRTLAGPVKIAVSRFYNGEPLPCGLATDSCADTPGLRACIDNFYANDGACGTGTPLERFPTFTAMPPANDFATDCFASSPPCTGPAPEVRFAVDSVGNLLLPVNWAGILVRDGTLPLPRLLQGRLRSPFSFMLPDKVFLGSYTPEGGKLPPIFEPQRDPNASPDVAEIFGSADAPYTILRFGRRHGTCSGGANSGDRCETNVDCPGGSCALSCVDQPNTACATDVDCWSGSCGQLFDVSGFVGDGPLVLERAPGGGADGICQATEPLCNADCGVGDPCVTYAFTAEAPVPLEGLVGTPELRAFAISETVALQDFNEDNDQGDTAVVLRDRVSGDIRPLGAPAGCGIAGVPVGRAVVRITDTPYTFPAVVADQDLMAFLESEATTNNPGTGQPCDINGNGQTTEGVLRVFLEDGDELSDSIAPARAVHPLQVVNDGAMAISGGRVFYRSTESGMTSRTTERVSVTSLGQQANVNGDAFIRSETSISPDGRFVAFHGLWEDLVPGDSGVREDVFVRDRVLNTTERITPQFFPAAIYGQPTISDDGRFVAFVSNSNLIVAGDANGVNDVFVRDRCISKGVAVPACAPSIFLVSANGLGNAGNGTSNTPEISGNGRFVVFRSDADDLVPGDTNGQSDAFLYDIQTDTMERVNIAWDGNESTGDPLPGQGGRYDLSVSDDGRFVAFVSRAMDLLPPGEKTLTNADIFVRDRKWGVTERVSLRHPVFGGGQTSGTSSVPSISGDGGTVAFVTGSSNLIPLDTNGQSDIFVYDRTNGSTERVSVSTGGGQVGGGGAFGANPGRPVLSTDGRFVAFTHNSTILVPNDTNATDDVFLHDRLTRTTVRVSVQANGAQVTGEFDQLRGLPAITGDGSGVAWGTFASNVVPGDTNFDRDYFFRGPDSTDTTADDLLFDNDVPTDAVLEVFDSEFEQAATLCPATQVAVAGGQAAFLRPESDVGTVKCLAGNLNIFSTDELISPDTDDLVVYRWLPVPFNPNGSLQNMGRAAIAVSVSPTWIGILADEAGDQADYNGDSDENDGVVQLHPFGGPVGFGSWHNVGVAASSLQLSQSVGVFLTHEIDEDQVLNGDGLKDDRVLGFVHAQSTVTFAAFVPETSGQAAEEFVVGEPVTGSCGDVHLAAFRTRESAQDANLNDVSNGQPTGDLDEDDDVLQVINLATGVVKNTGQAVTPCLIPECDPRMPYRVDGTKVTFLTFEPDQGVNQDLSGDGSTTDLVIQVYDYCQNVVRTLSRVEEGGGNPLEIEDESRVFRVNAGRCTTPLGINGNCTTSSTCAPFGAFCGIGTNGVKRCMLQNPGTCLSDDDCPATSECREVVVAAALGVSDQDDDGVLDDVDNCPATPNTDQADVDLDGVGDACDAQSCGNSVPEGTEACDDGNGIDTDACKNTCSLNVCGDGVLYTGVEECDDGAGNSDSTPDACRTDCTGPSCGDSVVDSGEECDDGPGNDDVTPDACRTTCSSAYCGDSVVDTGESCDDGPANSDTEPGACRTTCTDAFCGDGIVDGGEECDAGVSNSDTEPDTCRTACVDPTCGDGVKDATEQCDDGNAAVDDGCTPACLLEKAGRACQEAIAKAGAKYFDARLKALQRCRNTLNKGRAQYFDQAKTMPLSGPEECEDEYRTAGLIAKAGLKARLQIAKPGREKCGDVIVGGLGACAGSVDGLVNSTGDGGCLITTHRSAVDVLIDDQYGNLVPAEQTELRKCQEAIAKAGRGYAKARLGALQRCYNTLNKGRALYFDQGKTLALSSAADCGSEYRTALKITKAALRGRKLIAQAGSETCSDPLVAQLAQTCAAPGNTVDGVISPAADSGCVILGHTLEVDGLIGDQY